MTIWMRASFGGGPWSALCFRCLWADFSWGGGKKMYGGERRRGCVPTQNFVTRRLARVGKTEGLLLLSLWWWRWWIWRVELVDRDGSLVTSLSGTLGFKEDFWCSFASACLFCVRLYVYVGCSFYVGGEWMGKGDLLNISVPAGLLKESCSVLLTHKTKPRTTL